MGRSEGDVSDLTAEARKLADKFVTARGRLKWERDVDRILRALANENERLHTLIELTTERFRTCLTELDSLVSSLEAKMEETQRRRYNDYERA